jgi:peroxiredoxin
MTPSHLLRILVAPAVLAAALCAVPTFAEEPPKPGDAAKPAGAAGAVEEQIDPTKQPPKVEPVKKAQTSPEAQAALDAVSKAYKDVKSLTMTGKLTADFDIDGQKVNNAAEFTASFQAPNKFRHEVKDDVQVGSTGEKVYAYQPKAKAYLMADAPKERAAGAKDLPNPMGQILDQQNPSLLLALVADAAAQLLEGVSKVDRVADVKIDDVAYTTLNLTTEDSAEVQLLLDPSTNLVRRVSADMTKAAAARGQQDVKRAQLVIDYTDVKAGDAAKLPEFAWAPPAGAKDAAQMAAAEKQEDPSALEGKAAPDFALKGMDDKEVKLSALKGSVVVLDFWATWCPPCRASLPHLDELNKEMAAKGVKVFAVNLEEDKDAVKKFIDTTKLTSPVLLDSTGATAQAYGASAIPQTVVVGKDGKIAKVFVGFNPNESPATLKAAVEAAMKK